MCKSIYKTDTYTPMFIAVLFTIAGLWNQLRCPIMEYYSAIKKETVTCRKKDGSGNHHVE
jgi:hypothetical protein